MFCFSFFSERKEKKRKNVFSEYHNVMEFHIFSQEFAPGWVKRQSECFKSIWKVSEIKMETWSPHLVTFAVRRLISLNTMSIKFCQFHFAFWKTRASDVSSYELRWYRKPISCGGYVFVLMITYQFLVFYLFIFTLLLYLYHTIFLGGSRTHATSKILLYHWSFFVKYFL